MGRPFSKNFLPSIRFDIPWKDILSIRICFKKKTCQYPLSDLLSTISHKAYKSSPQTNRSFRYPTFMISRFGIRSRKRILLFGAHTAKTDLIWKANFFQPVFIMHGSWKKSVIPAQTPQICRHTPPKLHKRNGKAAKLLFCMKAPKICLILIPILLPALLSVFRAKPR